MSETTTVSVYKQRNRHGFHVLMTVVTVGLWAFTGWPLMLAWNYFRSGKKVVTTVETRADGPAPTA